MWARLSESCFILRVLVKLYILNNTKKIVKIEKLNYDRYYLKCTCYHIQVLSAISLPAAATRGMGRALRVRYRRYSFGYTIETIT